MKLKNLFNKADHLKISVREYQGEYQIKVTDIVLNELVFDVSATPDEWETIAKRILKAIQ